MWLDPPLTVILARLWRRSVGRIRSGEEIWGGNREMFRNTFLSRDSLFVWALKTHLEAHRFTRASDAERWLAAQGRLVA